MNFDNIFYGKDFVSDFYVFIEISANSVPVKYEFNDKLKLIVVDRFINTSMNYPTNYGFIPNTLTGDGDPIDSLVITPFPLCVGSIIKTRAVGMLDMYDESGYDPKIISVPINKVCSMTSNLKSVDDIPDYLKKQIKHFFEQYKSLENKKWVKVKSWKNIDSAYNLIRKGIKNYKKII